MEKCLITKLLGTVNDDTLTKLNEIMLYGHSTTKFKNGIGGMVTLGVEDIRIVGDAYFTDSTGSQNLGKTKHIDINNEGLPFPTATTDTGTVSYIKSDTLYNVFLSSKYEIKRFVGTPWEMNRIGNTCFVFPKNVDVFKYSSNLENVECDYMYTQYNVDKSELLGIEGDISVFANKPNLLRLCVAGYYVNNSNEYVNIHVNLTGDIKSLGTNTKMILVDVQNTDVYGKVEDLLNALYANGKTDGSIQIFANHTLDVTYEGENIDNKVFTFTSDGWSVKS